MSDKPNDLYQKIADTYLEHYGEQLHRELAELEDSQQLFDTNRMDRRVSSQTTKKWRRLPPAIGLLAACLLLFLLVLYQNN